MIDILFFSYRSTDSWWRYLAEQLHTIGSHCVLSDMRGEGDINLVDLFYQHLAKPECSQFAVEHFSMPVCEDIIRRCRVLRNLKKQQALSMIGAMYLSIKATLKDKQPRLVMSFIIDRYVADILERCAKENNIRFLGMTASIVPEHVMFMDRGRLIPLRQPSEDEIVSARKHLLHEKFVPVYAANSKKYSFTRFWKTFLYYKLRGTTFQAIRYLKRDKYNLHYLDALNSLNHKPRLGDHKVLHYLDPKWNDKLEKTPHEKRVFLGLQLLPEASLDYWLNDLSLLDNEKVILEICQVLSKAGYTIFVKDHPLQFGFRKRELIQQLAKMPAVVLVPYDAPAAAVIKNCTITVTFTGTIGFEGAIAGCCSVVSNAYYSDDKHFVHFQNFDEIAKLPNKIAAFQQQQSVLEKESMVDSLISQVLAASAPGDLFSFRKFDKQNPVHIQNTASLVNSLRLHLPQFLKQSEML